MSRAGAILLAVAAAALAAPLPGRAQPDAVTLEASVDRPTVRENESFTYMLRAEGQFRGEPDLSPLERDFDVLDRSRTTRVQILNGRASQIAEWMLQLMPKSTGRFTLPAVALDNARANSVEIEVLPALAGDAPGDIFLEVEVSPDTVYVQSQLLYTLRVFRAVSTGRATLTAPEVSGGEAIVEQLDQDRDYQTVRDGRDFLVRERRFAIFPQQAGRLRIEPVTFEAVVIAPSGFSSVQRFRSEAVEVSVEGPVPPPAGFPDAVWLPARQLSLAERWSEDPAALTVGVPQTRTVTIEAQGVLETQLPELRFAPAQGLRQYPDRPELVRESDQGGLRSRRIERLAVIAQAPGELTLPAVSLPWWNVVERRWEIERIEPRTVHVRASPQQPPPPVEPAADAPALGVDPSAAQVRLWQVISAVLLVAWLATLALWWQTRTHAVPKRVSTDSGGPRRASERRLLRRLRQACRADDGPAARRLLLEWAALRFPDTPPRSLGALIEQLPEPIASRVRELEGSLYGASSGPWQGGQLADALDGLDSVARAGGRQDQGEPLLPLYR